VVFDHIGDTYAALKQTRKALEYWEKAQALEPENKKIATKIAEAKSRLSKSAPAGATPLK